MCRYDLQKGVRKLFFKQVGLEIFLSLGNFKVPKNCSSQENYEKNLINKKSRKFRTSFWRQLSHKSCREISAR